MTYGLESYDLASRLFWCAAFSAVQRKGHYFQCTFIVIISFSVDGINIYIALCSHEGGCSFLQLLESNDLYSFILPVSMAQLEISQPPKSQTQPFLIFLELITKTRRRQEDRSGALTCDWCKTHTSKCRLRFHLLFIFTIDLTLSVRY